jgi:short-subunit dehydrogenase
LIKIDNSIIQGQLVNIDPQMQGKSNQTPQNQIFDESGEYEVLSLTHSGDTWGDDWSTEVVGIGRNEEKLQSLQAELGDKFTYHAMDVSVKENWLSFSKELERQGVGIDLLINNAGVFPLFARIEDLSSEQIQQVMNVNFYACVYGVEALMKQLGKHGGIVNICSSGALCTVVGTSAYSASKSALKGYTEALILEEKQRYVGLIFPGTTATELFRNDENTKNSALDLVAMSAEKMSRKILRKIDKKRKRAVVGLDAKAMNTLAKLAPVWGLSLIAWVMRISKSKVFNRVFKD